MHTRRAVKMSAVVVNRSHFPDVQFLSVTYGNETALKSDSCVYRQNVTNIYVILNVN